MVAARPTAAFYSLSTLNVPTRRPQAVIAELKKDPTVGQGFAQWEEVSGVGVKVRRGPIGVMLGLAPFNCAPAHGRYAYSAPRRYAYSAPRP